MLTTLPTLHPPPPHPHPAGAPRSSTQCRWPSRHLPPPLLRPCLHRWQSMQKARRPSPMQRPAQQTQLLHHLVQASQPTALQARQRPALTAPFLMSASTLTPPSVQILQWGQLRSPGPTPALQQSPWAPRRCRRQQPGAGGLLAPPHLCWVWGSSWPLRWPAAWRPSQQCAGGGSGAAWCRSMCTRSLCRRASSSVRRPSCELRLLEKIFWREWCQANLGLKACCMRGCKGCSKRVGCKLKHR